MKFVCLLFVLVLAVSYDSMTMSNPVVCRDPDLGGPISSKDRKFLLIGGSGAGNNKIANFNAH